MAGIGLQSFRRVADRSTLVSSMFNAGELEVRLPGAPTTEPGSEGSCASAPERALLPTDPLLPRSADRLARVFDREKPCSGGRECPAAHVQAVEERHDRL